MKQLEIRLSLPAVAPLLQRLDPLAGHLRESLANPVVRAQDDEDFKDFRSAELLENQQGDLATLASLFDEEFHKSGLIVINERNAEGILRACAALRLRLRETELTFATDAQLESGEPDFDRMDESQNLAYGCYVVLATLQEIIIDHLYSEDEEEDDDGEDEDDDETFDDHETPDRDGDAED